MTLKEENDRVKNNEHKKIPSFSRLKSVRVLYIKWALLVLVFLLLMVLSAYVISPYSEVNDITVDGTSEVYDQDVYEQSHIIAGDSLFDIFRNRSDIEETIVSNIPQVSDARLSVSGLQSVKLTVSEYDTVAYLLNEDSYFKILENGVILDESLPRITSNQPVLLNFSEGATLNRMIEEYDELNEQIKSSISEIELMESDRNEMLVRAFMNDGNEVLASIPSLSERLNYYLEMRETVGNEKGLFDLEAGAYFIPFTSEDYDELEEDVELGE